ncbi:MAG: DUF6728 family protein [Bacteroidia bacterium]
MKSIWQKIWGYITFSPKDNTSNMNLKFMHGMNRISILVFLVGLLVLISRLFR